MHLVLVAIACEEEGQGNCEQQKKTHLSSLKEVSTKKRIIIHDVKLIVEPHAL